MENPALNDPEIFPTREVLFSHLGRAKASFVALVEYNHKNFPDFNERWKYYCDGKSWLMNVSRKKKTLFWLSVGNGFFRTGFYFHAAAEHDILNCGLPEEYKNKFMESAGKKFRGISVLIKTKKDIDLYKTLLSLKLSFI
ncbi:MAG TPA: DUF3788 family protein [Bacteroidota bacterium]|nr:DUF3788 family protein [Bacteroidota bacterium]